MITEHDSTGGTDGATSTGPEQNDEAQIDSIVELVIECWRFAKLFTKIARRLDAGEAAKYVSQLRYFQSKIEDILGKFHLKLINLEGQAYEPGMAVTVLNIDDFHAQDDLIVDQMTEPVVMSSKGLKRMGTVILRRAG